jgi:DNA-directed RNA polymerase delta subunit
MQKINYSQTYAKLTKGLLPKTKDIFDRRFGITDGMGETLESIGKSLGITRERVRQIEKAGFNSIKKNHKESLEKVLADLAAYFDSRGGFKREEVLLEEVAGKKNKPYVLFFLTMGDQFSKVSEKKDYHYFWRMANEPEGKILANLAGLVSDLEKHGSPLEKQELHAQFASKYGMSEDVLDSYLGISKRIQANKEGKVGLTDWPEIRSRSVKDRAFLVFRKHGKPLHFRQITEFINQLESEQPGKKAHPQTVHNELIKDERFVLVGKGMYALGEWGYTPGTIKDVITRVLKNKPNLAKDEIVKEVLSQRFVEKNTVLIKLNNKKYFQKNAQGNYFSLERQLS